MPFLSFLPSEASLVNDSYNLVVDALFGFSFKGPPRPDFATILETLKNVEVPLASIDVPSGMFVMRKKQWKDELKVEKHYNFMYESYKRPYKGII